MGIFGNDEGHDEIDLEAELAEGGTGPIEAEAPQESEEPGLVRVRVTAQHNGLRRGDVISVSPERAENMVKSGVGEVA